MPNPLACGRSQKSPGSQSPVQWGRLAAAAGTAPPVYFAWLRLGAVQMEALPSALGKRAGMRRAVWLAPGPFGVMRSSSKCMYANREPMLTALQELEWWAKHTLTALQQT